MPIEKSVFISYRRTNIFHARAIFQDLRANGYDVFMDYESIDSGSFSQIILNQIKARAHFIIILTPSALERCINPDDWLRREIEIAIDEKRNIVPLMFDGFDWRNVEKYLVGKLSVLNGYNSLVVPSIYFEEAMNRLRTRFLNIDVSMVIHPTPQAEEVVVAQAIQMVANQLSANEYLERGNQYYSGRLYDEAIRDYNEAIRLNPHFVSAYNNRGIVYMNGKRAYNQAIADYTEAIHLNPQFVDAYHNRGNAYYFKGEYDRAIADYNEAIRLNPEYANVYYNRGNAYNSKKEYDRAIADYDRALEINPNYQLARMKRSLTLRKKQT